MATKQEILKELAKIKDETTLSSGDLKTRLGLYQQLKELSKPTFDPRALKQDIFNILAQNGIPASIADQYSSQIGTYFAQTGKLPTSTILGTSSPVPRTGFDGQALAQDAFPFVGGPSLKNPFGGEEAEKPLTQKEFERAGSLIDPLLQHLNDKISGGGYNAGDPNAYDEDITRVQGLYDSTFDTEQKDALLKDTLDSLPDALTANRNEFLAALEKNAKEKFDTSIAPSAIASLNARGAIDSGDYQDLLTLKAGDLQSLLEQQRMSLEEQDTAFYRDAAYQYQLKKSLQTAAEYRSSLEGDRSAAVTDQNNRFRATQNEVDRNLEAQLYYDQQNRNLATARSAADKAASISKNANKTAMLKAGAGAAGAVGGAYAGGPAGSVAGYQIGSSLIGG